MANILSDRFRYNIVLEVLAKQNCRVYVTPTLQNFICFGNVPSFHCRIKWLGFLIPRRSKYLLALASVFFDEPIYLLNCCELALCFAFVLLSAFSFIGLPKYSIFTSSGICRFLLRSK